MVVHEVSLVDRPANERPFVVVKADSMKTKKTDTTTPAIKTEGAAAPPPAAAPAAPPAVDAAKDAAAAAPEAEQKAELVLSPELKQALVDALSTCVETISAMGTMVADAKTEEGAPVPPNLGEMLRTAAAELISVADQYTPAVPSAPAETEMAAAPATPDAAPAEAAQLNDATIAAIEQAFDRVIERRMKEGQAQKSETPEPTTKSALEKKLDELSLLVKASNAQSVLGSLAKAKTSSNANPVESTAVETTKRVRWGSDLSAEVMNDASRGPAGSR